MTQNIRRLLISLVGVQGIVLFMLAAPAFAARFYFSPASGQYNQTCTTGIDIFVDTQGASSNAADIELNYNPAQVDIIDNNPSIAGVQIQPGIAYESYFGNQVDTSSGKIKLSAGSFTSDLNGNQKYATVNFKSKPSITAANFTIRFDGAGQTLDSNVADTNTSLDLLTSVGNGSYTFVAGDCIPDTTPPAITFISPTNTQQNVPGNNDVQVRVTDALSGVDLTTVQVIVDGVTYTSTSPGVTVSGTPQNYLITIDGNQHAQFQQNVATTIRVNATDLRNNSSTDAITFNIPPSPDTDKPIIEFVTPTNLVDPYSPSSNIVVNVSDSDSGININRVEIYINDILFTSSSPGFSYTGDPAKYTVTLSNYLPANETITKLRVRVTDFAGNVRESVMGVNVCTDNGQFVNNTIVNKTQSICIGGEIPLPPGESVIKDFVKQSGTGGALATLSILGFLATLLPWINLLNAPSLLVNFFVALTRRRNKQSWGIIYDRISLQPLSLATIRIYLSDSTSLIAQEVSDMNGRYRIVIPKGAYRIEVMHPQYIKFSKEISLDKDGVNVSLNIPMSLGRDAYSQREHGLLERLRLGILTLFRQLRPIILFGGLLLALFALIYTPSILNFIIFSVYALIAIIYVIAELSRQKYAVISDSETGYTVPAAVIKFYNSETMEVVETQVTNAFGQFDFFGESGEYLILVAAWGYNFPSHKQKDLTIEDRGVAQFIKANLKTGKNHLRILLDPRSGDELVQKFKLK